MLRFALFGALSLVFADQAVALTCSLLPLPTNDLGARIDMLAACLGPLGDQIKDECSKDRLFGALRDSVQQGKGSAAEAAERELSHRCREMYQDFSTAMALLNHEMELSRANLEAIKSYDQKLRKTNVDVGCLVEPTSCH